MNNTPRVFADLHHGDLYYSLQLLFEKRLGWELYRPIGLDWYHQNYWHVYPHINTAKQYLDTENNLAELDEHHLPKDPSMKMNDNYLPAEDGIYYSLDPTKGKVNRGITLDRFSKMPFDILISSIPAHIKPFNELIAKYHPNAKHIFQIGNSWSLNQNVSNVMASCAQTPISAPAGTNVIFYHQEFDLDTFSYQGPAADPKSISSFVHYMKRSDVLNSSMRRQLPDWSIRMYGAGMPNSSLCLSSDIANAMRSAGFIWHVKPGGDGFGHVIHNAFAVGRPVITYGSDYKNKLAEDLLIEGTTYLDLENGPLIPRLTKIIETPGEYERMCEAAHKRFTEVVDYDKEAESLQVFINSLR